MSIYVFGYGSLINMEKNTELNHSIRKSICPVTVKGLKRSLNVNGEHYRVFGVKDVKTALCNGLLFKVTERELANLIEREKLYTLKPIKKDRIVFNYGKCLTFKPNDEVVCFGNEKEYNVKLSELFSIEELDNRKYFLDIIDKLAKDEVLAKDGLSKLFNLTNEDTVEDLLKTLNHHLAKTNAAPTGAQLSFVLLCKVFINS